MSDANELLWQTKLAARIHDPAEKALVLLRDPAGHENGTSRALARLMGYHELERDEVDHDNDQALVATIFKKTLPTAIYRHIQRADWWAAAADRPQWPMAEITVKTKTGDTKTFKVADWAQVRWTEKPLLVHPLTGETINLLKLREVTIDAVKQRSFDHFTTLLVKLGAKDGEAIDWRKILLVFWRFGPELGVTGADTADFDQLGALWELMPADTRVPDHSVWDHLDLTSAFAGAFAADPNGEVALLALSIGPVQSFIAAARKLDDLWAGSHLLSRLSWETMRPMATELGPDAILFPRLRGLAQVDLWLRDEMHLPADLFDNCEWNRGASDANPLFAAALPNRFVAVVPAARAKELAERCGQAARDWIQRQGEEVVRRLLEAARIEAGKNCPAYAQFRQQLSGFPEVHWAAVSFSLIRCRDAAKQRDLDVTNLKGAMAPFFGVEPGKDCGFLSTPAWQALAKDIEVQDGGRPIKFFTPNPGVIYPAVYDLAERVLAAAKSVRAFDQIPQEGWRESLTGETEWLTHDRRLLTVPAGKRKSRKDDSFKEGEHAETLWTKVADEKAAWAKKGEHLGALSALKRLWPTVFADEMATALGREDISRFAVSTHAMALAGQLDAWLENGGLTEGLEEAVKRLGSKPDPVVLPRKLVLKHGKAQPQALKDARLIPALLDAAAESDDERVAVRVREAVRKTLATAAAPEKRDAFRLETYYGLLMMDGDKMGKILSGDFDEKDFKDSDKKPPVITYRESFHEQVRKGFDEKAKRDSSGLLTRYGEQPRAVSPGRHLAISAALNDFSQHVARHVVEEEHLGRLIYAGGDDVLAVLPVTDLLVCSMRLRHAYSGTLPEDETKDWGDLAKDRKALHCKSGFAWLGGHLMRMMGKNATASAGLVVAHHQAPLGMVLRELRATEQRAKTEGGRDAVSITVIKRSGGSLSLTLRWSDVKLLEDMIAFLRSEGTSRRAVYHSLTWLDDLPDPQTAPDMLEGLLGYQLARQSRDDAQARPLARTLVQWARVERGRSLAGKRIKDRLTAILTVAEFFAREVRSLDTIIHSRTQAEGAAA